MITPLPTPPNRNMPDVVFVPTGDEFLAALPTFVTEANALAEAVEDDAAQVAADRAAVSSDLVLSQLAAAIATGATDYLRRSADNLSVGAGAKNLTGLNVPGDAAFADGEEIALVSAGDAEVIQWGLSSAVNPGAGTMTVTVAAGDFAGAGPLDDWLVFPRAWLGMLPATVAEIRAKLTGVKAITPKGQKDANARVPLAYASTVTPDLADGWNRSLDVSASFTMGAPTNCDPGDMFKCDMTNTAGGVVFAVVAAWDRQGGLGIIGPNNGDKSRFVGFIEEVDGSRTMTKGVYNIVRTPD